MTSPHRLTRDMASTSRRNVVSSELFETRTHLCGERNLLNTWRHERIPNLMRPCAYEWAVYRISLDRYSCAPPRRQVRRAEAPLA